MVTLYEARRAENWTVPYLTRENNPDLANKKPSPYKNTTGCDSAASTGCCC